MADELGGRNVVVTGASGALGSKVAADLQRRGATLFLPFASGYEPGIRGAKAAEVDLTDEDGVAAYYRELPELWASIHLVGGFSMGPTAQTRGAEVERLFRLNALSAFLCCKGALGRFSGGGRIVNVAARTAEVPMAAAAAYSMSKAAVAALTQSLAAEVGKDGVLVNAILPSIIDSPANRSAMPKADHASWPKPAELAQTIAYLASPSNTVTNGALVPVYGRA